MSRKKTHNSGASSTDMGSLELTRNGYERNDFVVDSDDEGYFESGPRKRKSNADGSAKSTVGPGLRDTRLESLTEIHQEVVHNFVGEAKGMEETIRNNAGMRRPLFSEQNFQDMAIHWTTTPEAMRLIRGIDGARVDKYGERFARLVRRFHKEYTEMMGPADDDADMDVVDLISSDMEPDDDDGGGFEYDIEPDDESGEKSRFFSAPPPRGRAAAGAAPAEVEQWHQRLNQLSQKPPGESGARGSSGAGDAAEFWTGGDGGSGSGGRGSKRGGRGGGRGGRGFKKGRKFSGVSKRKSGGSAKGGGGSRGGSAFGKGGRGGGKGGGASGIGLMPH